MEDNRYHADSTEKAMQEFWEREKIYEFKPDGREIFSIDTPPPTVSGSLHIGHIFSYTQAEIIARFMRMQGKNVFYPFGFDNNGLPSERLVEKEQGITAASLPRSEFTKLCGIMAERYVGEFRALWQSMGFSVDWSQQYETIGERAQRISQCSFIKLAKTGKAYQKETPVLWCTNCRTSIAQAELDTAERDSAYNTIPFVVEGETLPVATTRPELLYGCVALFIHPDDERYQRYLGKTARVPLYDFEIPILADEKAEQGKGTGVVMCATFGDTVDLEWYGRHNLPYKRVVEPDGRISPQVPHVGGLKIAQAREKIVELLNERGLLLGREAIRHTVSVHERCGKEVEIIPSRQWFIDILSQKDRFEAAADEIEWHPAMMKTRYKVWVQNLKWDWCISRQRYFGVPFPVWYCKSCGKPIFAEECQLPVNPLEGKPLHPCECGCEDFVPETAVMDTWATSSLTPFINAHYGEPDERPMIPMGMRTQAHEIIRTWAFYTIVRSLYETGKLPWKSTMICGYVLAKKGEKISKSKGNASYGPRELIAEHSADGLRYWAAGARLGTDTLFSLQDLKISSRFITKLWNAGRFVQGRLAGFENKLPYENLLPPDRWILERCRSAQKAAEKALREYDTGAARSEIDDFFWKDFCDNYLEIVKERLYNQAEEPAGQSAFTALYEVFLNILKLYAPYVPHITEQLYQNIYRERLGEISLHSLTWEKRGITQTDERLLQFGELLKETMAALRKFKTEHSLSLKTLLEDAVITVPTEFLPYFEESKGDIMNCCVCRQVSLQTGEKIETKITL